MTIDDINYEPHSDAEIDDMATVHEHNALYNDNKFSDATTLLEAKQYIKGIVAPLFNLLEQKLRNIQIFLLNKQAAPDELYSYTEPTDEQMQEKMFWIKPVD